MVEERRDKTGPFSLLEDSERSKWKGLCEKWALKDIWSLGPWCSSPGYSYISLQYDNTASRLDRCYCSHKADWLPTSVLVSIDYTKSLSDHLPLSLIIHQANDGTYQPEGKKKNLVTGKHLFEDPLFRSLVKHGIAKFDKEMSEGNKPRAWKRLIKRIQSAIKRSGPEVKMSQMQKQLSVEQELEDLSRVAQEGGLSKRERKRWLAAKAEVSELQLEEVRKLRLRSRALFLKPETGNQAYFFRALKIKKRRDIISSLINEKGDTIQEPNKMANVMLQHLSKIIGQPEDKSQEVKAVREELLSSIKRTVHQQ